MSDEQLLNCTAERNRLSRLPLTMWSRVGKAYSHYTGCLFPVWEDTHTHTHTHEECPHPDRKSEDRCSHVGVEGWGVHATALTH